MSGPPKRALEDPQIKELLKKSTVEYLRRPGAILARRATIQRDAGPDNQLITWIIDHRGLLVVESVKEFTAKEVSDGIYVLRYPGPLGKDENGALIYNEWFVTETEFKKRYHFGPLVPGLDGADLPDYREAFSHGEVRKRGIIVNPQVIEILGGAEGAAILMAPWGLPMRCVLGGLLTQSGSSIAPGILRDLYDPVQPIPLHTYVRNLITIFILIFLYVYFSSRMLTWMGRARARD